MSHKKKEISLEALITSIYAYGGAKIKLDDKMQLILAKESYGWTTNHKGGKFYS
jgi:hypothetical protein